MAFPSPSEFHAKLDAMAKEEAAIQTSQFKPDLRAEPLTGLPQNGIGALAQIWLKDTAEASPLSARRIVAEEVMKISEKAAEDRIKVTSKYYLFMGLASTYQGELHKLDEFVQIRPRPQTAPGRIESSNNKRDDRGQEKVVEETSERFQFPIYDLTGVPEWPSEWPQYDDDSDDTDNPFAEEDAKLIAEIEAGYKDGYKVGQRDIYTEHSASVCDQETEERRVRDFI